MKKALFIAVLALVMIGAEFTSAHAKDEFEKGFKTELGAVAARSAVGLGVSVVNGVLGGGVAYNGYYARPAPIYRPYYRTRVVYAPPPPPPVYYRVDRRYYAPYAYPPPPPPVVQRTYEYHYHYH